MELLNLSYSVVDRVGVAQDSRGTGIESQLPSKQMARSDRN